MAGKVIPLPGAHLASESGLVDDEIAALTRAIGQKVRSGRDNRGESRRELSERSGVSQRYLAQIEAGEGNISVGVLVKLGRALEIPVADFLSVATPANPEFRIALVGLRGAGKSTLGQRIAKASGVPFVELNDWIESESGLAVADVIALYGPEGYRDLEKQALEKVTAAHERLILAVAGGIVDAPGTFDLLLARFHTIWLQARPEEHMERVIAQGDERPMAGNPKALEELKAILRRRELQYARAHRVLDTSGKSLDATEVELRSVLENLRSDR